MLHHNTSPELQEFIVFFFRVVWMVYIPTRIYYIFRLYVAGCDPTVNNLYPPIEYPVPRGTPSISPYCNWFHGDCDTIQAYRETYFVSYTYVL